MTERSALKLPHWMALTFLGVSLRRTGTPSSAMPILAATALVIAGADTTHAPPLERAVLGVTCVAAGLYCVTLLVSR